MIFMYLDLHPKYHTKKISFERKSGILGDLSTGQKIQSCRAVLGRFYPICGRYLNFERPVWIFGMQRSSRYDLLGIRTNFFW